MFYYPTVPDERSLEDVAARLFEEVLLAQAELEAAEAAEAQAQAAAAAAMGGHGHGGAATPAAAAGRGRGGMTLLGFAGMVAQAQ